MKEQWNPSFNPCTDCGACCVTFRVSFYWREAEQSDQVNAVPKELCEDLNDRFRCMKGTNTKHNPQCIALKGTVGEKVGCSIYSHRPSPCRDFEASFVNGKRNLRCDDARLSVGLKPLQRHDWFLKVEDSTSSPN